MHGRRALLAAISFGCAVATIAASLINLSVHEAVFHARTASDTVRAIEHLTSVIRLGAALFAVVFAVAALVGRGPKRLAWMALLVAVVSTLVMGSTILM